MSPSGSEAESMRTALMAGFGRRDITPSANFPNGIWMAQRHLRAEGVHRPLFISCVIVGHPQNAVAILSYDLTILSASQVAAISLAVQSRIGLPQERIWLYVTHNHAAPVTQDFYDKEGANEVKTYIKDLVNKSADAAEEAWRDLSPARAGGATGHCTVGANRDLFHNGRMIIGPNMAGFTDPDLGVLRLDDHNGKAIAAILTYGCHPTFLGPENKLISPDFPGVMRDVFEAVVGAPCLFLQAGGGNVGPIRGFRGGLEDVEHEGKILACEAGKVFLGIDTQRRTPYISSVIESGAPLAVVTDRSLEPDCPGFDAVVEFVSLPTDHPGPTVYDTVETDLELEEANVRRLKQRGAPVTEVQAATQRRLRHQLRLNRKRMYFDRSHFEVRICALRLDEVCFVSLACEAFAEIAVEIKEKSPFACTIFAAYEGPDVIYVAPRKYYKEPASMEVYNSPFGPSAAEILIDRTTAVLAGLRGRCAN